MTTREKIISYIKKHPNAKSSDLVGILGISRQTTADHLKRLVNENIIQKRGSTRNATYSFGAPKKPAVINLDLIKSNKDLHEDAVYDEIEMRLHLKSILPKNVRSIIYYAFSEMLNNAIDHSKSKKVKINFQIEKGVVKFIIRDSGIGIFKNVQSTFGLKNEYEGAEHLFKGKQTTMPSHHSGQGIFFTSRIADRLNIRSHKLLAAIDNEKNDVYLKDDKSIQGTEVEFKIKKGSKKNLQKLFHEYANEDFEFDRSEVKLRLHAERELISRSQARRLVTGLEKYKKITFDFQKIPGIGQAFTDEVFRVFRLHHPDIKIEYINANASIEFMIQRCLKE